MELLLLIICYWKPLHFHYYLHLTAWFQIIMWIIGPPLLLKTGLNCGRSIYWSSLWSTVLAGEKSGIWLTVWTCPTAATVTPILSEPRQNCWENFGTHLVKLDLICILCCRIAKLQPHVFQQELHYNNLYPETVKVKQPPWLRPEGFPWNVNGTWRWVGVI